MAHYIEESRLAELVAGSRVISECADHGDFDGSTPKQARLTAPYKQGDIVKILVWDFAHSTNVVSQALIYKVEPTYSEHSMEWVDHYIGFIAKKGGGFQKMFRHIKRGDITRGYGIGL